MAAVGYARDTWHAAGRSEGDLMTLLGHLALTYSNPKGPSPKTNSNPKGPSPKTQARIVRYGFGLMHASYCT
eukprot:3566851-Pyramimonas_sp.AAC.2